MKELWVDVKGYEGVYQVSNMGRVRSLNRVVSYANGRKRFYAGKMLTLKNLRGYPAVGLRKSGSKQRWVKVHKLVAEAFVPRVEGKTQVNHIDENKFNNRAENLEWCTAKENINHGTGNARRRKHNLNQKATSVPVRATDSEGNTFEYPSIAEAARANNCTVSHIWGAVHKRGRQKTACGMTWAAI